MKKKPNRSTVSLNMQIDSELGAHLRKFSDVTGDTLRDIVELAVRRHLASPPPTIEIPPLPPLTVKKK